MNEREMIIKLRDDLIEGIAILSDMNRSPEERLSRVQGCLSKIIKEVSDVFDDQSETSLQV